MFMNKTLRRTSTAIYASQRHSRILPRLPRHYNGQIRRSQHVSYFQEPDPTPAPLKGPKLRWRLFRGTLIALLSLGTGLYIGTDGVNQLLTANGLTVGDFDAMLISLSALGHAETINLAKASCPGKYNLNFALNLLQLGSLHTVAPGVISHTCRLASNTPCEDQSFSYTVQNSNSAGICSVFGVIDGHAGATLGRHLVDVLANQVLRTLGELDICGTAAVADDKIASEVKQTFVECDALYTEFAHLLVGEYISADGPVTPSFEELRKALQQLAAQHKAQFMNTVATDGGACALIAIHDPVHNMLHIANTGDSRAVLGRWDEQQQGYIAIPLSSDHTGFNQDEVKRLEAEHPGEDIIDKSTGRIFGLAVTRAFGDLRWKVSNATMDILHRDYFLNPPRPNNVIKTPPYLTAEPEVKHIKLQLGKHPDFLIIATDGLWDQLTSEQCVELMSSYLKVHSPLEAIENQMKGLDTMLATPENISANPQKVSQQDNDTYYDEEEKVTKWNNSSKHFCVDHDHAAEHLIRNALGGKRKELFRSIVTVPPPLSRAVKDDITTTVVFFGQATTELERMKQEEKKRGRV